MSKDLESAAKLKALKAMKGLGSSFADGGSKPKSYTSPEDYVRLGEENAKKGKSAIKVFEGENLSKMRQLAEQIKGLDQRGQSVVMDRLRAQLSGNPIQGSNQGLDLADFTATVRGANPVRDEAIVVPGGNTGHIEDISRVSGQVPVDSSSTTIRNVTEKINSPKMMAGTTGAEFAAKQASLDASQKAKSAMKRAALEGLKKSGKLALGAIGPVTGIASALSSGNASAAIPGMESEDVGTGSDTQMATELDRPADGGYMSPERQKRLAEMLRTRKQ